MLRLTITLDDLTSPDWGQIVRIDYQPIGPSGRRIVQIIQVYHFRKERNDHQADRTAARGEGTSGSWSSGVGMVRRLTELTSR